MSEHDSTRRPFPLNCPVKPLGIRAEPDGTIACFYATHHTPIVRLDVNNRHGKGYITALFGKHIGFLESPDGWPKYGYREGSCVLEVIGWRHGDVVEDLIVECCRKGIFDLDGAVS